jgi:hypothetical protein
MTTESKCHRWPRICYVYHSHNSVLSSLMHFHYIWLIKEFVTLIYGFWLPRLVSSNYSYKTGAISGSGYANTEHILVFNLG